MAETDGVQMIDVPFSALEVGEFFATSDNPPANVFIVRVASHNREKGTVQCIHDETYWTIEPQKHVRRIDKSEYDRSVFHVK